MRKILLDKSFDPLDMIMTGPIMTKYAIKPEDIKIPFDKFIKNTSNYTDSDIEFYENDLRHSIVAFFFSYKYKYREKTTPNTFIGENYGRFEYSTAHSAQSSFANYKKKILNEDGYLKDIFEDIFDNMKERRSKTLSKIGANVFAYSICRYSNNPARLPKSSDIEKSKDAEKIYHITTLQKFISETNFTNVEEYIFERIYHVKLICEILNFYYEFKYFIDKLSDDIFSLGINTYKKQSDESDESDVGDVSVERDVSDAYEYKYFDFADAWQAFKEYGRRNALDLDTLKERGYARLNVLFLELCRFSLLDDVYTRTDVMKSLIKEMMPDIMKEEVWLDRLKQCVACAFRNSIIECVSSSMTNILPIKTGESIRYSCLYSGSS